MGPKPSEQTRFVVLSCEAAAIAVGALTRVIVVVETRDGPGSLAGLLETLAERGAGLVRLECRPGIVTWSYRFVLEFEQYFTPRGAMLLYSALGNATRGYRVIGAYPVPMPEARVNMVLRGTARAT